MIIEENKEVIVWAKNESWLGYIRKGDFLYYVSSSSLDENLKIGIIVQDTLYVGDQGYVQGILVKEGALPIPSNLKHLLDR